MACHLSSIALQGCCGLYSQYRPWWFRAGELSSGNKLSSPVFGAPPRERFGSAALDHDHRVTVPRSGCREGLEKEGVRTCLQN